MNTTINIHSIARIDTGKREELPCGEITRAITATDEKGDTVTIILFAEDYEKLTIRGDKL